MKRKLDKGLADLEKTSEYTCKRSSSPRPTCVRGFLGHTLMDLDGTLTSSRTSFALRFSSLLMLLTTGAQFILVWWFRKSPVFWLPQRWFPGPVAWLLSFPSAPIGVPSFWFRREEKLTGGTAGSVSSGAWCAVCKRVLITGEEIVRELVLPSPGETFRAELRVEV